MLRCVRIGISVADLDLLTVGLVADMFVEYENDDCEQDTVREATAEDIMNF